MSKKNSMNKAAKNVAYDVCDSKKARINKLKKMEKDSKQKLEKSPEDIKKEEQSKATFLASYEDRKIKNYTTISAFEHTIFAIEGFHIIVRASSFAKIRSYPYRKRCGNNNTIEYFINKRLKQVTGSRYEFYLPYEYNPETTLAEIREMEEKGKYKFCCYKPKTGPSFVVDALEELNGADITTPDIVKGVKPIEFMYGCVPNTESSTNGKSYSGEVNIEFAATKIDNPVINKLAEDLKENFKKATKSNEEANTIVSKEPSDKKKRSRR